MDDDLSEKKGLSFLLFAFCFHVLLLQCSTWRLSSSLSLPETQQLFLAYFFVRGEVQKRLSTHDWLMSLYLKRCVHFYIFFTYFYYFLGTYGWVYTGFVLRPRNIPHDRYTIRQDTSCEQWRNPLSTGKNPPSSFASVDIHNSTKHIIKFLYKINKSEKNVRRI